MTPGKWSLILILAGITLLGLPIRADSDAPTEEIKPSSAKDCRVHIEKALEQYWDHKESSDTQTSGVDHNTDKSKDYEEYLEKEETTKPKTDDEINQNNIEDEDDEEDDVESEEQSNISEDDEDEESDEDDEDDDEDDVENDLKSLDTEKNDDYEISHEKETTDTDENSDDDDDEEEEEDVNDDEEDEDDDEESETQTDPTNNESNKSNESNILSDIVDENTNTNEADLSNLNDEEDDEEEDDEEEEDEEDDDEEETDDNSNTNDTNIKQNSQIDESSNEIKIEIQVESDKVTGEADSASSRVESEFLDEKPSSHQPQASYSQEKNITQASEDEESGSELTDEINDLDDDSIENIYEDEDDDAVSTSGVTYRSRDHIDVILGLDEIGTEYDKEEEKNAQNIYKEIKKIHLTQIKPMELLYKYTDSTSRALGDAEIFNTPMLLFLGPWSAGKTSIINYLLGIERTPAALKTGTGITDVDFTLITYGDQKRVISGTELAADWRYAGVQKFGQGFLDHFRSIQIQHTLLKKVTIVDSPGILENKKNTERGYSLNDAFQWFIDRADAIYVVLDPNKVDIGGELGSVVDQLKGRDARFILNKADTIRRSDLMRVVGQLFWNLSPLMSSSEAPVIYAVSLTTKPYHPSAPAKFLSDQEKNFFYDMKSTLDKRVENRILYARRHAVRVRNHAKMVDCYLATYYRHKSIFSSKRNVAKLITENPREYNIFDGLGGMTNISRYDLPDPIAYREFFKLHPLYDFKPLASTCSYFRGCPMDKLDLAISKDIPELLAKYKKMKLSESPKQER